MEMKGKTGILVCFDTVHWPLTPFDPDSCMLSPHSESPYSEHGALEEVDNEGGTETHTSEDGE